MRKNGWVLEMQRIKTLHNIMGSKDTSLGELNDLINSDCFKEDRPQTRAKTQVYNRPVSKGKRSTTGDPC